MIPLYDLIKLKYPDATIGIFQQVVLADYGDGKGPVIQSWNVPGIAQPTEKQLKEWQTDVDIIQDYTYKQNDIANAPIYDKLNDIDMRSIRALRTDDTEKLTALEQEAETLRAQLLEVE